MGIAEDWSVVMTWSPNGGYSGIIISSNSTGLRLGNGLCGASSDSNIEIFSFFGLNLGFSIWYNYGGSVEDYMSSIFFVLILFFGRSLNPFVILLSKNTSLKG